MDNFWAFSFGITDGHWFRLSLQVLAFVPQAPGFPFSPAACGQLIIYQLVNT